MLTASCDMVSAHTHTKKKKKEKRKCSYRKGNGIYFQIAREIVFIAALTSTTK